MIYLSILKKALHTITFFAIISTSQAQSIENVMSYYNYTNLANRDLMHCKYKNASMQYDTAFSYIESPFFIDYIKNILIKIELSDSKHSQELVKKLIEEKHIEYSKLSKILPLTFFSNKEKIQFKEMCEQSSEKLNKRFIEELKELFRIDQEIRNDNFIAKYEDEAIRKILYKRLFKSRDSLDLINAFRYENLIHKYGFPTEKAVGVYADDSTQWATIYYIFGIHFVRENDNLLNIYKDAAQKGKLHPSIYASVSDFLNENTNRKSGNNFMNTTVVTLKKSPYKPFVYYTDSLLHEVDFNRRSIGLDSFAITQEQVLKTRFCNGNNFIRFDISPYLNIHEFPPGLVAASFQKEGKDLNEYKLILNPTICDCK